MPEDFVDPYIDSSTGVLRNLVGAMSYDGLNNAEGELASSREAELLETFDARIMGLELCRSLLGMVVLRAKRHYQTLEREARHDSLPRQQRER